ncbi:hypothetical protein [Sphingosinithalassobacter portus]|uniref:hypothetical protein n=1 Tax=Stakelama portus TaxID=2676234 RepID=UPI000D6EA3C0|nr:hypothetical protein [Sphingosinithalassobacter portus]
MDITQHKVADTSAIHIKNAAGEPLYDGDKPVRIHVYGPGSKAYATVEARQSARAVKRMQDNDGKVTVAPHEERLQQAAEDLAAITVRFENLEYPPAKGKEGAELFEAVYADPALGFIANQVRKFVGDWGNFRAGSGAS